MIMPQIIVSFAIGGAIGSAWSAVVFGRALSKRFRQFQELLAQSDLQREQFKALVRNWLVLARRVGHDGARVERVAWLLAEMEARDALKRGAEHVT